MVEVLLAASGWLGGALVVARVTPQALLCFRSKVTSGVPVAGVWAWLANDLGWLVYGLSAGLAPVWASSLLLLALDVTLLSSFAAQECVSRRALPGVLWLSLVVAAAAASEQLLASVLLVGAAAGTLPHAWEAARAEDLSGVSPLSWRLGVADGSLWLCYGLFMADVPVLASALLTLATSLVVLAFLRSSRPPQGVSPHLLAQRFRCGTVSSRKRTHLQPRSRRQDTGAAR